MKALLLSMLLLFTYKDIYAQYKEFSTYFAFEDAAGKRDTLFFERKTGATNEVDPQFGEVPALEPLDSNIFFVVTLEPTQLTELLKGKLIIEPTDQYFIDFGIYFIDVEYPITVTMDTSFLSEFDHSLYNYITSPCQTVLLIEPPDMWYEANNFECIQRGKVTLQDPYPIQVETGCVLSNYRVIDIIGHGKVNKPNVYFITIVLDDYCNRKLQVKEGVSIPQPLYVLNPTGDELQISVGHSEIEKFRYEIYDISGHATLNGQSYFNERVDTHSLPAGIYLIRVMTQDGRKYQGKFIKME